MNFLRSSNHFLRILIRLLNWSFVKPTSISTEPSDIFLLLSLPE
nr:MAG TPA: hypothetical protein [Caudoviricetes sp.]